MSYILDALRRADAERSRGAVPGLHDQNGPGDDEPAARDYTPLIWAAAIAGTLVVAGGVLLWAPWRGGVRPADPAPLGQAPELARQPGRENLPVVAQGETPPAQPGGLAPATLPAAPPMDRGANGGPAAGFVGGPPPYPPPPGAAPTFVNGAPPGLPSAASAPPGMAGAGPAAASGVPEHYGPPIVAQQPQQQQQAPQAATPVRAGASPVPNINALPADVRAQLPRLAVGGAIYSEAPSARMVILNGQVWHEGEKPAADTVLEQIRLKSAVLNFRGTRYEINY
jgi:general secretion pathway protein B